jgi:hypothetical protein
MSCTPINRQLQDTLDRLNEGQVLADKIPADLLEQLRRWGWVIGQERLELTGVGIYHAGPVNRGLLGDSQPSAGAWET